MTSRAAGEGGVVFAGSLAQRPGRGGHTWVFLQYLLGFRALGREVTFLDRLEPEMCVDAQGNPVAPERSPQLRYFERVMGGFGLDGDWAVLTDGGGSCLGLDRERLLERVRGSALLLNVNGFIDDELVLEAARRRVYLDIDPGFGQMWRALGLHDPFAGHDAFVTVGEKIGDPDCEIPTGGLDWVTTPQPVFLDQWPDRDERGERFTSVGAWRGTMGPVEYEGRTYGLRVHEFRRFAELPRLVEEPLEIALDIHSAETADIELLRANGWLMADPAVVAADPGSYRDYVQRSAAELMVAKNMYVAARSGWFSDRSICYLASGRPVLAQETGFSERHPVGEGLLAFETVDEAREGVERIAADWRRHSRAARALAEERFDARLVLASLLERLG